MGRASTAAALSQRKQGEKNKNGGKAEATMEGNRSERAGEGTGSRGRVGEGGLGDAERWVGPGKGAGLGAAEESE